MITGKDPTPEERRKIFRSQRFSAIINLFCGVTWLGLGVFELSRGRYAWPTYCGLVFAPVSLCLSWVVWTRARKYAV